MRPLQSLAIALLLYGCASDAGEPELTCPAASVALCTMTAAQRDAIGFMTQDARVRVAAALSNTTAKAALTTELNSLQEALASQHVSSAAAALDRANVALTTARNANVAGDAQELSAIELALSHISLVIR